MPGSRNNDKLIELRSQAKPALRFCSAIDPILFSALFLSSLALCDFDSFASQRALEGISDMDIPGRMKTKVGTCSGDEKESLVGVACALRGMLDDVVQGVGESPGIRNLLEYAAQSMFIEGVSSQERGIEGKVVKTAKSVTTCACSCAHHAKLMDITIWSRLPEELQELVFACLPWPQIYRVRILSKGWNQKLMSGDSQLKRACARTQSKLFGLLAPGDGPGSFIVNMFDIASNRWHTFETSLVYLHKCGIELVTLVTASDGGLVCLLSKVPPKSKKTPRFVFVCNPLTQVWKQLPPLYDMVQEKIMVQLIMDRKTKHYRVIVVGYCEDPKVGNLVNVYHSKTGQWTKADDSSSKEVVFGYVYNNFYLEPTPCSYNFANGLVHEIVTNFREDQTSFSPLGNSVFFPVLVKDHLFHVKDVGAYGELPTHCVQEYQAVDGGASWTLLKEYPFNRLPRTPQHIHPYEMTWFTRFFACKDFLLLNQKFVSCRDQERREFEFLWLYEFSGKEWRELPMMAGGIHLFAQKQMCELRFDSVP